VDKAARGCYLVHGTSDELSLSCVVNVSNLPNITEYNKSCTVSNSSILYLTAEPKQPNADEMYRRNFHRPTPRVL